GRWRFFAGLFDKLKRRKRNVDGEVLAGLDFEELRLFGIGAGRKTSAVHVYIGYTMPSAMRA
ncbi:MULTISPECIES: hypothetical protein, partial [Rhodopseudomonas]